MRAGVFAAFLALLAVAIVLMLFGPIIYVREAREFRRDPVASTGAPPIRMSELQPGLPLSRPHPNSGGDNPSWYERDER